jgi:hypothetical protein
MATFEEHCADCVRELGEPFKEVHQWLDGLFGILGPKHRSARHHSKGVEVIREKHGDRAARAAEIHILKDYYSKSVPTPQQAQMWSLFGPDGAGDGKVFLTDGFLDAPPEHQ